MEVNEIKQKTREINQNPLFNIEEKEIRVREAKIGKNS